MPSFLLLLVAGWRYEPIAWLDSISGLEHAYTSAKSGSAIHLDVRLSWFYCCWELQRIRHPEIRVTGV